MARKPTVRARPSPQARAQHADALARWQEAHGVDVWGFQGRESGSQSHAIRALRAALYSANIDAYVNQLNRFARTVGHSPAATRNTLLPAAADRLRRQADESAQSIVQTQIERGDALREVYATDPSQAADAFDTWNAAQQRMINQYESGRAAGMAMRDVIAHNPDLPARARVEPTDTAGLDDECDAAVDRGEIDAKDIDIDLPAHPRCPHFWSYEFGSVADPQSIWVGGGPEEE
jgi:hypothetical protein